MRDQFRRGEVRTISTAMDFFPMEAVICPSAIGFFTFFLTGDM